MNASIDIDARLEEYYNARAAIPEFAEILADWALRSEAFRKRACGMLDLPYGDGEKEALDLFPAAKPGAPLHVFIHGGYWQSSDKSNVSFLAEALVEAGISVALVNYALCPAVSLDDIVAQVRRALHWLWLSAPEYGLDPTRIHISGHSAGGQLTGMLLATDWREVDPHMPAQVIKSAVSISGLFDLLQLIPTSINKAVGLDEAAATGNSPLFLEPVGRVPYLLAVGERESAGFHWQSDLLAEKWGEKGVPVERLELPGCHHLSVLEALAKPDSPLFLWAKEAALS